MRKIYKLPKKIFKNVNLFVSDFIKCISYTYLNMEFLKTLHIQD